MLRVLLISLFSTLSVAATSQTLYMPRSVQKAFTKGTRASDGRSGNYWQNKGCYKGPRNTFELTIGNPGGMAIQFDVVVTLEDLTKETLHISLCWEPNEKSTVVMMKVEKLLKSIKVETGIFR